ncbi:ABC transporter permease subunit, partial [Enterococcus lactis]
LNLQAGYAGLLNFGHIAFAGIGAYATGISTAAGYPAVAGAALGVLVAVALGWCVARLGRQLGADYWGIATLAIAEILR